MGSRCTCWGRAECDACKRVLDWLRMPPLLPARPSSSVPSFGFSPATVTILRGGYDAAGLREVGRG